MTKICPNCGYNMLYNNNEYWCPACNHAEKDTKEKSEKPKSDKNN